MALSEFDIQKAYVAFFNRPADVTGLAFWGSYPGTIVDLLSAFKPSPEYQALFAGKTTAEIITTLYNNIFNRAPEAEGLAYWSERYNQGLENEETIAFSLITGALNNGSVDTITVTHKLAAAIAFTDALQADPVAAQAYEDSGKGDGAGVDLIKAWLGAVDANTGSANAINFIGAAVQDLVGLVNNSSSGNNGTGDTGTGNTGTGDTGTGNTSTGDTGTGDTGTGSGDTGSGNTGTGNTGTGGTSSSVSVPVGTGVGALATAVVTGTGSGGVLSDAAKYVLGIFGADQGGKYIARWNFPEVEGKSPNEALVAGIGDAVTLTYSFLTGVPDYYANGEIPSATEFSAAQKAATVEVLARISAVANITFVAADTGQTGQLTFANSPQSPATQCGYASFPSYEYWYSPSEITTVNELGRGGDVWINSNANWTALNVWEPGGDGFITLLHEIGHALGLKHPHDPNSGGTTLAGLSAALDNERDTVESYTLDHNPVSFTENGYTWTHYLRPETMMALDTEAYAISLRSQCGNADRQ